MCVLGSMYTFSPFLLLMFFFQAEDGIRDGHVTGVQTCALPIFDADFSDSGDEECTVEVEYQIPDSVELLQLRLFTGGLNRKHGGKFLETILKSGLLFPVHLDHVSGSSFKLNFSRYASISIMGGRSSSMISCLSC